ncbi:MAG: hypothetical protein GH151_00425 [Bacteroidetes bacterium]|nr:hypothetical protein [Bacteroidota bacterium]
MKNNILLFIGLMLARTAFPQSNPDIKIIPQPQSIHVFKGSLVLKEPVAIIADDDLMDRAIQIRRYLEPPTGFIISMNPDNAAGSIIELKLCNELEYLGEEGYKLEVTEEKVNVTAFHSNGIFWGIQSLRQLLPKEIMREAKVKDIQWVIPCLSIEDKPRFRWRGLMIDYSRTFWNKRHTKRIIYVLAW